jgi:hypothetical protein
VTWMPTAGACSTGAMGADFLQQPCADELIHGLSKRLAGNVCRQVNSAIMAPRARFKRCQRFSDFLAVDFRLDSPTARVWIRFPREAGGEIPPAYSPGRPDIPSIHKKWKLL